MADGDPFCCKQALNILPKCLQGLRKHIILWYNAGVDVCHSLYVCSVLLQTTFSAFIERMT